MEHEPTKQIYSYELEKIDNPPGQVVDSDMS
jgi:hypothetical protein